MTAASVRRLNNLQRWFARLVLQVGPGAPNVALTRETGLLEMGLRVAREKVLLVLHVFLTPARQAALIAKQT